MSLCSSASVMGWSGRLRSWLWLVVKPLTSSPAMPMTTWVGWMPAIASASRSAARQLSTTPAMSVTVPDCMWREPLPLAADARARCPSPSSIPNTSALTNSVPMSSEVPSPAPCRRRGPGSGAGWPCVSAARDAVAVPGHAAARWRRARPRCPSAGRPCPAPSPAGRRPARRWRAWPHATRSAAETPRATRSSLTVTKTCGSSSSSTSAMMPEPSAPRTSLAKALSSSIDAKRRGQATSGTPPMTCGAAPPARRARAAAAAAPARRRFSRSRMRAWSSSMRAGSASGVWAPAAAAARSRVSRRASTSASAASPVTASMRRMPLPMERSAGDDEAADLARSRGSGCRRTARGCSPRRARCARSRRTSRRRTRRRRPSIASCHGHRAAHATGRSSRTTPPHLGLDGAPLLVG